MIDGNVLHASTTPARSVRSPAPYEIRRYDARLRSQVLDLQGHLWHLDATVNDAYLEWKYYRNPYMGDPVIHVALSGGRVVGMRGVYGAKWEVGNPPQQFIIPCAGDLVVAPDHRDLGLLLKILEAAAIDLATSYPAYVKGQAQRPPSMYVFSLSAGPASQLASLLTGWRNAGYLEPATRQSSWRRGEGWLARLAGAWLPARLVPVFSLAADAARDLLSARRAARGDVAWSRAGAGGRTGSPGEDRFVQLDRRATRLRGRGNLSIEKTPRPSAMAEVVQRVGSDGRIRHVRDAEYFAWRFQNPLSRYRFLFWTKDRLEGYLVLQTSIGEVDPTVNIVDWEGTNETVRGRLLDAAIQGGNFRILTVWAATLSSGARMQLRERGFSFLPEPGRLARTHRVRASRPVILVRSVGPGPTATDWTLGERRLLELHDWDLRGIYSDTF